MSDFLYGRNPILESLRASRRKPKKLFLSKNVEKKDEKIQEIMALVSQKKAIISLVNERDLEKMGKTRAHQGLILETEEYPYVGLSEILNLAKEKHEDPFILILDLVQDPQNFGSLIRTAEAMGVHGIVIQEKKEVGVLPSVVSSSSGAVEHLFISQVSNISQAINKLKDNNVWVYGLEKTNESVEVSHADLKGAIAIVVGSEGEGMRHLVKENCDGLIYLPMEGKISSLNAAVAGSMVLFKVWEQRKSI